MIDNLGYRVLNWTIDTIGPWMLVGLLWFVVGVCALLLILGAVKTLSWAWGRLSR